MSQISLFPELPAVASRKITLEEKIKLQERALRNTPFIPADRENIFNSMPLLLPHQVENVWKAEKRFFNPAGEGDFNKGILFTDNTGSGKTYTGLAIMKRFEKMRKPDMLIVVPTDAKAKDWIMEGRFFGFAIYQLKDTKDAGRPGSIVITTYANFRQNLALKARAMQKPFNLVLYDESHKIMSNEHGASTEADEFHKQVTFSIGSALAIIAQKRGIVFRNKEPIPDLIMEEARQLSDITKVVFLSASPFSYHKNLIYADGYLFQIKEGLVGTEATEAYKNFFIKNFGYRMIGSSLVEPEAATDVGNLERQFHTRLIKTGAVSSTRMILEYDYSREFILIDDKLGMLIDDGFKIATDSNVFNYLPAVAERRFNFIYRNQLLESIKAKKYIPRIQRHLDLGRKVVLFHTAVNSKPEHPFDFSDSRLFIGMGDKEVMLARQEIAFFHAKYPQFRALDLHELKNPIQIIVDAFGSKVGLFNGEVPNKRRGEVKSLFNKDDSGMDIIMAQMEAGKEGLSLHDTTGVRQRVEINFALPFKPTDAIQSEGRIYRVGQRSNAVIEYPVTHLNFEKTAFALKINERVKTAENLAFGEGARNLKEAFKEGYKTPTRQEPGEYQGVGSRDSDMIFGGLQVYEMAIRVFMNRIPQDGYISTPEPLGIKMVEWLQAVAGDHLLEPSAGHGAIARAFPENTINKFIEPDYDLRADLTINASGDLLVGNFEDHNVVNKYHGIVMHAPHALFVRHFAKAFDSHLRIGGRMITILPEGMANELSKKYDTLFITGLIKMPVFLFQIGMEVVCMDKHTSAEAKRKIPQRVQHDLSHLQTHQEFFAAIKDIIMPVRVVATEEKWCRAEHVTDRMYMAKFLQYIGSKDTFSKINEEAKKLGGAIYCPKDKGGPGYQFFGQDAAGKAQRLSAFVNSICQ